MESFWRKEKERKKKCSLRFDDGWNLIGNSLTAQGNPLNESRYRRPRPRRGGRSRWGEERYADYRYLCNTDLLRTKGQGEEGTLPGSYSFRRVSCTCRIHPRGCWRAAARSPRIAFDGFRSGEKWKAVLPSI